MSTISIPKQKKHRHDQDFIKRSTGEKIFNVLNILVMLILLCFFLFPVFNVVSISLSDDKAVLLHDRDHLARRTWTVTGIVGRWQRHNRSRGNRVDQVKHNVKLSPKGSATGPQAPS